MNVRAERGRSKPPLHGEVARALAAGTLGFGPDADPNAAYASLVRIALRSRAALILARALSPEAEAPADTEATDAFLRAAGLSWLPDGQAAPPDGTPPDAAWAPLAAAAAEGVQEGLGSLYEELLTLRVRRLDGEAVCVRASGVFVECAELLVEPPATRAKWLQRRALLPKSVVPALAEPLARATSNGDVTRALARLADRAVIGTAGALVVEASVDRRRAGAHYTPPELCRLVVERTLEPLARGRGGDALLALRVCDPAMGDGAFLAEAARFLAARVEDAFRREGRPLDAGAARALVVSRCVFGVDRDPVAVDLARFSLAVLASAGREPPDLSRALRQGDALLGPSGHRAAGTSRELFGSRSTHADGRDPPSPGIDWPVEFAAVFDREAGGFDACVGNPPWVAYVGRAAQPLPRELARFYERTNPAFAGYRTLHGLFVRRSAELLAPGGRLGLVLPTSVADLEGYAPTRSALLELCEPDEGLLDFGDGAFHGVFQPCMALTGTRRARPAERAPGRIFHLSRSDLDAVATRLLERLSAMPRLDAALFGERGFQTTEDDLAHIRRLATAVPPHAVALHEGGDVGEMTLRPPSAFIDPSGLRGRLRPDVEWEHVRVLIRQTARYPIATLSDGMAFRNSILAGFSSDRWPAPALATYLNSSAIRFFHYTRHRDARQGMPQLKIGHLRALPELACEAARAELDSLGGRLAAAGAGITPDARTELDAIVFDALDLVEDERRTVLDWARANPLPRRRSA